MKKERRKIVGIILLSLFLVSLFAGIAAAQTNYDNFKTWIKELIDTLYLNPVNITIFLLGLLLWIIIFSIVRQVFHYEKGMWNHTAATVVSLIIVILTFMFIPDALVEAIALQYTAMGAALLAVIPFAIILYFTMNVVRSTIAARVTWIFYIIYYAVIFIYKIAISTGGFEVAIRNPENFFYIGAIIAGFIIFAFTEGIKQMIFKGKLETKEEKANRDIQFRAAGRRVERAETESRLNVPNTSGL